MRIPRLVIAGTGSSVGKTTVTLALLSALAAKGRVVQPFKAGPDFIDPAHHTAVTGRPSRNLDGWMLDAEMNRAILTHASMGADLALIEGMMGLFDGIGSTNDEGSTAELAKQLGAPVLLVVDGGAMARSAAALVEGFARFDPDLAIAGVLFNRVNSPGHYRLLKNAVEQRMSIPAVGYLRQDEVVISERHLGLVGAGEGSWCELYRRLGASAEATVDLDLLERVAATAAPIERPHPSPVQPTPSRTVRIGVARDPAFCFYYADNLQLLESQGGELVYFSPILDAALPHVDMLYLGGGYPELHAAALSENRSMRRTVAAFSERGGTIFAECGGMMYLTDGIRDFEGRVHEMAGVFPALAVMRKTGLTLGYRRLELSRPCILGEAGTVARGHEFHYSVLEPTGALAYAYQVADARGERKGTDGLVTKNTLAGYTHLHFGSQPSMISELLQSAGRGVQDSVTHD
ncbi:MAG: cobyrinate a,c-diamide synthase [Nitrospiraceae bacterium]|nr:cobyrinate a,c-diamide synthase [Nitrospiraceae bacterium]